MKNIFIKLFLLLVLLAAAGFAADNPMVAQWRKKAEAGDAKFQGLLGFCYNDDASKDGIPLDYAEAEKWYRLAAVQGNLLAQTMLGAMYTSGEGVPKDTTEAVKWWRLAAEQGFAKAQFVLGSMYHIGEGVPKDDAEAVKWFRLAAEQGDAAAQSTLGVRYHKGEGLPKDLVQAHVWINIGGANGDESAKNKMPDLEKEMTSEQKAEAMKLARELFAKLPKKK